MPTPRRSFLKTTAAAGAAASLTAAASPAATKRAAKQDFIRVGVIGCGGRGSGAVGDAINAAQAAGTTPVKLVAMADVFEDHLSNKHNQLSKQFGDQVDVPEGSRFIGFDGYRGVLEQDLDYVIIATPPGFRPIHFAAAVEKGLHIFCEKPVATDAPGIRKFLAAVEESKKKKLKVGVGLQRHHQNSYLAVADQIRDGAIGDIIAMKVYWNSGGVWDPRKSREQVSGEMEYQMRNWYYYCWLCGDQICEQHIHNLDVGNWWAGIKANGSEPVFPTVARGMGGREVRTAAKYGNIFDHTACQFEYADGTQMISEGRHQPGVWNSVSETAHGSKGTLTTQGRTRIYTNEKQDDGSFKENIEWAYRGRGDRSPYVQEHMDLQAAMREGSDYNEGTYGAMSTMTAILGRMACYSGKEITMEDALNNGRQLFPYDQALTWESEPPVLPGEDGFYEVPTPGVTNVLS
ncbi:Gfo/Idh/MocA family protein [Alienimonas chondri]|uniref:Inositol 2-dehydrogenase/D-chiro-inositol 3-dehydrogenase n=1 Tax=Alienimonas chondri TaxID=2681879 RepID=A0ABX1VGS1_9PLAN|nr:Gfo/Idh/MocA family oxidoreductase [Alienimonas chondri]NNJ26462.1 Inositol 2-dehydrogenase/D-chiro-inositol 3-dehydrogenase [Alienimonas chondri]